jgi:serine/threonine protein kinase
MPKLCPKCGAIYGDDDRFCHLDGSKLEDHPVSPPPTGSHPAPVPIDRDKYMGKTLLDQFDIFEVCGSGSMGTVYKARQKAIDRIVAVKILHPQLANQPEAVLRFHREAKVISNLNHPNIVHIYLFGHLPDGNLYIVQEFVDGMNLAAEMKQVFPVGRTIHIVKQVLSAIGEAHAVGVIHRDLKPENIMLTRIGDDNDFVKILDFGVAKKIVTQTFATREGLIFGSPKYISPEAAMGEKIDARSDLYSLGVMMYQMLAGVLPYRGTTPIELLMEHINAQPPPLRSQPGASGVPAELESIVMRLLAKQPDRRFPTAWTTREALEGVERSLGSAAAPPRRPEPLPARPPVDDRVHTAQATDSFAGYAKPASRTVQDSSHGSYPDYTTQEDVIGTQELYALQIRREKIKKTVIVLAIVLAVPVLGALATFGYRGLRGAFFPYDRIAGGTEPAPADASQEASAEPKIKEAQPGEKAPPPVEAVQADITIENEEVPVTGVPVKFVTYLRNETSPVDGPHYLIKRSDSVEMKLSAIELLGAKDDKRAFAAEYAFPEAGPYIVTFASNEKKYSPSVRIHIQEKGSAKKKKQGKGVEKGPIIKEIEDTGGNTTKPSAFGPDITPVEDTKDTTTEPAKGIKIIEKPADGTTTPPPKDTWY